MSQFVSHILQPIACGASFNQILQSRVRESHVTVRESYITAYCMWSVIQSQSPISISLVSFQRNVPKEFVSHILQPIACGVSFNLNLQSQSHWCLFNGTRQRKPIGLDYRLRFEIEEMTIRIQ